METASSAPTARPRVRRSPQPDLAAFAVTQSRRAFLMAALAVGGSVCSLYFNEAFVAFCGL